MKRKIMIKPWNLAAIEREVILRCLNEHSHLTLNEIAKLLGISERTLYRRLELYQVPYFKGRIGIKI